MHSERRRLGADLSKLDVPTAPGVYAWYRDGVAIYSGRAIGKMGLQGRTWGNHLKTGADFLAHRFAGTCASTSAFAPTSTTTIRPTLMTDADVPPVNAWIRECWLAWIVFPVDAEAVDFEKALHAEWLPPLSKR